ncbi:MAG: hypothetical protein E7019_06800 [Alphaproteobacteria bacterium]|nr:hypothetical protein [Alphaproteobacteria bacterium]
MSEEIKVYPSGEQAAKLEAFEKSIENGSVGNISEDEKRRQKELEMSDEIAREAFNYFKDGKLSVYQTLVNGMSNPKLKKLLSTPFMSTLAQGAATVAWTGAAVISEKVDATLFLATSGLAFTAAANTLNSLRKTKMARVFGYALKNSFKDSHNTAEKIERAKSIADAKERSKKINESKDRQQAVLSNSSEPQTTNKEKNTLIVERPFDKFMEGYRANLKQNKFRGGK